MAEQNSATATELSRPARGAALERGMSVLAPLIGLLVVILVFYAIPPHAPLQLAHLRTIAVHMVIVGIAALGMTVLIISGGIDLSVGSVIALSSVTTALALKAGWPVVAALGVALATGAACGLYNGLLVTLLRLPPFIATLGTLGFYRGLAKWISNSMPVSAATGGLEKWVQPMPQDEAMVFAPGVWVLAVLAVFVAAALHYSIPGRYAFAIGSNEATARLCGVRVERVKIGFYIFAGVMTGLAGLLQFARLTQGDPTVAVGLELDVIAAVVIGGGSLAGGQGGVLGTLAGAFLMAFLRNRCTVLGWSNYVQEMIVGHIIIVAVALDQWRLRRQRS
ncbi:Ribose transport system permease protein RbsC [Phycisphaerae bacterium RAS1]|nr:Ribose transport system permease protein RbsC [Phycisphaerae bacterium RAS1]